MQRLRNKLALRARARRASRALANLRPGRTSATDESGYLAVCRRAARDPEALAVFKRDPDYTRVLEHVTCQFGGDYLRLVLAQQPQLGERLDDFRRNDEIGSPAVCDYGAHGQFSPTTLRYVKVLADLVGLFGSLDGMRIIEIGAGYGGQCFVVSTGSAPASYTLVDLEPCLELARAYLDRLGVAAQFARAEELPREVEYDLVISNYAFSECVGRVQREYLERVLSRSRRGYLTMNFTNPPRYRSLAADELSAALPGARWLPEEPLTHPANRLLVWGVR
jgi:putative sugar O-methyltransferase